MLSNSLSRASAQRVARSSANASPARPFARTIARNRSRFAPSEVRVLAIQAPTVSMRCSSTRSRNGSEGWLLSATYRLSFSSAVMSFELNAVRAAGVAEICLGEQRVERRHVADHPLLIGVAQHGLEIFAVGRSEAIGPRVATQHCFLLLECRAHPGERNRAGIGDAPIGDLLRLLKGLREVSRHPGKFLHDLLLYGGDMHDRKDSGLAEIGELDLLVIGKEAHDALVAGNE